jgi:hypothetical protein
MKKTLVFLSLIALLNDASSQVNDYKNQFFNQCMATRIVTRDNEKYQVAYCKDVANAELLTLKNLANVKLSDAKKLLITSENYKNITDRKFENEGNVPPDLIRSYNELNAYQNPFLTTEFRKVIKQIYPNLKTLSTELIRVQKIESARLIGRDERCKREEGTGRYSNECLFPNDYAWFHQNNEYSLTLTAPR